MTNILAAIGTPFIPSWDAPGYALRPFVAELWLIAAIVAVLLAPFFTRRANLVSGAVALTGVLLALISLFAVGPSDAGEHFRGLLVTDHVAVFWKALLLIFVAGVILLWCGTTSHFMHEGDGPEFFTLLLGATLGMSLMASTSNLLMFFVAIEMASLPSYVLAGFRKSNRLGAEAAMKYVLFGAASSSVMVYGLSILYGLYGSLQMADVAQGIATADHGTALAVVAVIALLVGLAFKIAAVPFHLWCPDVFEGASPDITVFLSVASKGAAIILLLRVCLSLGAAYDFNPAPGITALAFAIGIVAAVTAFVGNTAAYAQNNIKRLLAYSSIAHAGYMLCAASILMHSAHAPGRFDPVVAATSPILLYLSVYMFMNLGAFAVVGIVYRETGKETLDAYRGLGYRSPVAAAALTCALVSLIGLIPFAGFTAKLNILVSLFQAGGWWWVLVGIIVTNTVVASFYYFRVIRAMYLETPAPEDDRRYAGSPIGLGLAIVSAAMLFSMLILFSPLARLTTHFSQWSGLEPTPPSMVAPDAIVAEAR